MRFTIPRRGYTSPEYLSPETAAAAASALLGVHVYWREDGFVSPRDIVSPVASPYVPEFLREPAPPEVL